MKIDRNSMEWKNLEQYVDARLRELRELNDNPTLDETETALIRGRIDFAKEILALGEPPEKRPEIADTGYID